MSKRGKRNMGRTIVDWSGEHFDVICDPCNSEGQRVQATGHCMDCNENMCVSCMKFHKKLAAVKDHVMKDKSTLSQSQKARTKANRSSVNRNPMTDRCPKHPDELIKFYCNLHRKLGCSDCISLEHRTCKDVLYIKDVSGDAANSDELTKIQTELQMLIARLTSTQSRTKWIKQTMNDSYAQAVSDISNLKKEIIDMLDQFESEILERASLVIKERGYLNSTVSACESAIRNAEKLLADIEKKKGMVGRNNQLFISMKHAQSRILDLTNEAEQMCNKSKYDRLSFQPDEQLNSLLSTLTSLGEMILISQTKDDKADYQHDINVKSDTDAHNCGISGLIVLPDGRLALSDEFNKSVKIVDVTNSKALDQIKFETIPIELTVVTSDTIAVTLYKERYIQVLYVSPVLSKSHTIPVNCLYYGIAYIPDKLVLVCREPSPAVHVCDMSGVLLQQIETDYSGNKLFTKASRIAISPDHGMMYVSDVYENNVVCLTMDGKLISKYASDNLKKPLGIAADDVGYVYVCSEETHSVHQLSPSGQLVKILLDETADVPFPFTIAYRARRLYIIGSDLSNYRNKVKVYRLQ